MADTQAATGLVPQHWSDQYFEEFIRTYRWFRFMGRSMDAMIHVNRDLTRKPGDKITLATIRELTQDGRTGDEVLEGYEEAMDSRSMTVTVDVKRHAVSVTKWQGQKSAINLAEAAKPRLRKWQEKQLNNGFTQAALSVNGVNYSTATAAQRNTWLADNTDRVLFGALIANHVSGIMATALATLDATDDRLSPAMISLAKRVAQSADPAIRPIQVKAEDGQQEWFVLFVHPLAMRDLSNNSTMVQANRDALQRGKDNPLFTGGDLIWDGVIVKEMRDMPTLGLVGAGAAVNVVPGFFMGAQALGIAWAQTPKIVVKEFDYEFRHGVAIEEIRGIEKLRFGTGTNDTDTLVQAGMVNVYMAAPLDG